MPWHARRRTRRWLTIIWMMLGSLLFVAAPTGAAPPQASPSTLQAAFHAAAHEWGVPEPVLLAVAYNLTRWEQHGGAPSTGGGYGIMYLTAADDLVTRGGKGETSIGQASRGVPHLHALDDAAALTGINREMLKHDPAQNIRGGAALLAHYARETVGSVPKDSAAWYGAVARYSDARNALAARSFAETVFQTINTGMTRTIGTGEVVTLAPLAVAPDRSTMNMDGLDVGAMQTVAADCPADLPCQFIPAAYELNNPDDPTDYGNYDVADRAQTGPAIRYIVIHDTEISYDTTIRAFQNPASYVSTHYVLRSSDGEVTQMVENKDVAWGAGNWYINMHSINIEHEGIAIEGAAWYGEPLYRSSARLVRYLADKYGVPLDRAHILGHDDLPGPLPANHAAMHWDPGPFWDWAHYMELIGAPVASTSDTANTNVVTINPPWATNQPPVTYCLEGVCRDVPRQPTSFVYLYTAPSFDAPTIDDPALPGPGSTEAYDWGNKAAVGQQFYRVAQQGDWDAIYFGGQLAWFHNPGHASSAVPGTGALITPAPGLEEIPVYGRAYPEASAYPEGIDAQSIVPLQYTIPAGQVYVATELVRSDYYWSPTQTTRMLVQGETAYYMIFFNHRMVYVKASDVAVVWQPVLQSPVLPAAEGATQP